MIDDSAMTVRAFGSKSLNRTLETIKDALLGICFNAEASRKLHIGPSTLLPRTLTISRWMRNLLKGLSFVCQCLFENPSVIDRHTSSIVHEERLVRGSVLSQAILD
jgi:hypothetical protein